MNSLKEDLINEIMDRNARRFAATSAVVSEPSSEHSHEMEDTLIRCLAESAESVFATMCGWELQAGTRETCESFTPRHDISGIIGLTGAIKATVVVSVDENFVFSVAASFLGERPETINGDVIDLVGELANMIGGNAKERLSIPNVVLGLPTVVAGAGHYVAFNSQMKITKLPFKCEHGILAIELGLV